MMDKGKFTFYLIALAIIAAILVLGSVPELSDYRSEGPIMTVVRNTSLLSGDSLQTPLAQGERVKFLGYNPEYNDMRYLVQTSSGLRGEIMPWDVDLPLVLGDDEPTDTIYNITGSLGEPESGHRYFETLSGTKSDGTEVNAKQIKIKPAIDDARSYRLSKSNHSSRFASRNKFEERIMGRNHRYIDSVYSPMVYMLQTDSGFQARLRIGVFDSENGFYSHPVVQFSSDTLAQAVVYEPYSKSGTASIAKYAPLLSWVSDMPLTSFFARDNLQDSSHASFGARLISKLFMWFMCLCWLIVPLYLAGFLAPFVYLLPFTRKISNSVACVLVALMTAIVSYYWVLVLIAWDASWWVVLLILFIALGGVPFSAEVAVGLTPPHLRCPVCHHVFTIVENKRELSGTTISTRYDKDWFGRTVGTQTLSREKTWTEVTDSYGDTSTEEEHLYETYRKEVEYDVYKNTFQTNRYRTYHHCTVCGHEEEGDCEETRQIGSEPAGTATSYRVGERRVY